MSDHQPKYSPQDWDETRKSFMNSMMVDTPLSSLAENVDQTWPLEEWDEMPSKYIEYNYEELKKLPAFQDNPERIDLLIEILKETAAFDDPFGEMAVQVEAATKEDDTPVKTLKRLNIPEDFPISLTRLSEATKMLCAKEDIKTVGRFGVFFQNLAQNIVVGGDFKSFLNALVNCDEETLATIIPCRKGGEGIHLPEALGLLINSLTGDEKLSLVEKYGGTLTQKEIMNRRSLSAEDLEKVEHRLQEEAKPYLEYFAKEKNDFSILLAQGQPLDRFCMSLNDPHKELIAMEIMKKSFEGEPGPQVAESAAPEKPKKKKGLLGALFGIISK